MIVQGISGWTLAWLRLIATRPSGGFARRRSEPGRSIRPWNVETTGIEADRAIATSSPGAAGRAGRSQPTADRALCRLVAERWCVPPTYRAAGCNADVTAL